MGNKKGNPQYCGLTPEQRLFKRITKTETCWNWTGCTRRGYGRMTVDRRPISTHRLSYAMHFGPIPENALVLHTCDNPCCVNPAHLFLGTALDNARDRAAKGRNNSEARKGEKHFSKSRPGLMARGSANGAAKLNESDVMDIREKHEAGATKLSLSKIYGVSRQNISLIVNGKSWNHNANQ